MKKDLTLNQLMEEIKDSTKRSVLVNTYYGFVVCANTNEELKRLINSTFIINDETRFTLCECMSKNVIEIYL